MKKYLLLTLLLLMILLAACSSIEEIPKDEVESEQPKACTREYNPQCGVDGITYANPCTAGDVEIAYAGECEEEILPEMMYGELCTMDNGEWDEEHQECLGVNEESCQAMGGMFNECASACRHNPEAQMCTMQCVVVCSFN